MSNDLIATTWSLFAGTTTGAKNYHLMLVDKYVVIGWGKVGGTMQYKVDQYPTPEAAKAWAINQTQTKEQGGYLMNVDPRWHHFRSESPRAGSLDWLDMMLTKRGSNTVLDREFEQSFLKGTRLAG